MLETVTDGAVLAGGGLVVATLVVVHLLAVQPLLGRRKHAQLVRQLAGDAPERARLRFYARSLALQAALLTATLAALLATPGLGLADGLRAVGVRGGVEVGPTVVVVTLLVAAFALLPVLAARREGGIPSDADPAAAETPALALVPVTVRERRLFAVLALTAGTVEEVVARGLALLWVATVAPGLPVWAAVVLTSAAFGVAHAYQGVLGVVVTGLVGAAFAVLYVASGSLLLPVVLHALLDLRVLLLPPRRPAPAPTEPVPAR